MAEIETETQVVSPSATEAGAVETPEGAEQQEATSAEKQEAVAPLPWAATQNAEELLDFPELRPHLERRDQRVEARLQEQYQKLLQDDKRDWESTNLHQTLAGHYGNLVQKLEDSEIDGADRILKRLDAVREPYLPDYQKKLQQMGSATAGQEFLRLMKSQVSNKGQDQIDDIVRKPGAKWEDVIDVYGKGREDKGYERGLSEGKKVQAEAEKVAGRVGGPNTSPASAGGGGLTLDQYKKMSAEEAAKVPPAEIDRMVQADYQQRLRT